MNQTNPITAESSLLSYIGHKTENQMEIKLKLPRRYLLCGKSVTSNKEKTNLKYNSCLHTDTQFKVCLGTNTVHLKSRKTLYGGFVKMK